MHNQSDAALEQMKRHNLYIKGQMIKDALNNIRTQAAFVNDSLQSDKELREHLKNDITLDFEMNDSDNRFEATWYASSEVVY